MNSLSNEMLAVVFVGVLAGISLVMFLVDRVLIPWQADRLLKKIMKRASSGDVKPGLLENPKNGIVSGDEACLRIQIGRDSAELRWDEIEEVHAWKIDLLTTDMICLGFRKAGAEALYEIHEEMAGYHDLLISLPDRLPGFTMNWFPEIVAPAFETNYRVIWKRTSAEPPVTAPTDALKKI